MRTILITGFFAFALTFAAQAIDDYKPGPDSMPQEGVPKGEVTKYAFDHSKIFPGTTRDYWIYVPKQYDPATPACVMVFQDGIQYKAPVVFDNLIAKKEIPVIIGVFVMHGRVKALSTNANDRFNRSYEYDGLGDNYARFLLEELLPEVAKKYNLSTNANDRAIAGNSSGAIAAFTAAWERPDAFRRVFSGIGTYVGLRGGNNYPTLIRKTEPKPIRVFLQDGSNDLNIYGGNWHLANQEMLSALEFAGYEVNHEWGDGRHSGVHSTAIFPEALRWLWKDWPVPITTGNNSKQPLFDILIPDEGWQIVSEGHHFVDGPTANAAGEVFFNDIGNKRIYKVGLDGKVSLFTEGHPDCAGLMFGPDGKLYGCQIGARRIVSFAADGKEEVIAKDTDCNDLAVTHTGEIYFTDHINKKIWFINAQHEKRLVDEGIAFPNGIRLTPDQGLLQVSDTKGQFVYSFQVEPDGSLVDKQRYFDLHIVDGAMQSGADGMTVDTEGRLYVTTEMGIQICDQAGRVQCIIPKPARAGLPAVAFGGANRDELYVACGDKLYKRKTKAKGVLSFEAPIKPPAPHL
ncbi:MAG TPA: SMP-30/gluconolactonase/LRE family protein [Verrucomicrobiae bacterium]|nr:SMP-30/gluconolactonase/LRE family protein [Verrucomicrobiae bacterium]